MKYLDSENGEKNKVFYLALIWGQKTGILGRFQLKPSEIYDIPEPKSMSRKKTWCFLQKSKCEFKYKDLKVSNENFWNSKAWCMASRSAITHSASWLLLDIPQALDFRRISVETCRNPHSKIKYWLLRTNLF